MTYLINIGLDRTGDTTLSPATVVAEINRRPGLSLWEHTVHESDTELTVVARVSHLGMFTDINREFFRLSRELGRDCVAVLHEDTGLGALHGPDASAWGDFNPEFFLQLDGTRLGQPVAA